MASSAVTFPGAAAAASSSAVSLPWSEVGFRVPGGSTSLAALGGAGAGGNAVAAFNGNLGMGPIVVAPKGETAEVAMRLGHTFREASPEFTALILHPPPTDFSKPFYMHGRVIVPAPGRDPKVIPDEDIDGNYIPIPFDIDRAGRSTLFNERGQLTDRGAEILGIEVEPAAAASPFANFLSLPVANAASATREIRVTAGAARFVGMSWHKATDSPLKQLATAAYISTMRVAACEYGVRRLQQAKRFRLKKFATLQKEAQAAGKPYTEQDLQIAIVGFPLVTGGCLANDDTCVSLAENLPNFRDWYDFTLGRNSARELEMTKWMSLTSATTDMYMTLADIEMYLAKYNDIINRQFNIFQHTRLYEELLDSETQELITKTKRKGWTTVAEQTEMNGLFTPKEGESRQTFMKRAKIATKDRAGIEEFSLALFEENEDDSQLLSLATPVMSIGSYEAIREVSVAPKELRPSLMAIQRTPEAQALKAILLGADGLLLASPTSAAQAQVEEAQADLDEAKEILAAATAAHKAGNQKNAATLKATETLAQMRVDSATGILTTRQKYLQSIKDAAAKDAAAKAGGYRSKKNRKQTRKYRSRANKKSRKNY